MVAVAVLLNADDLGLWPSVTAGIFDAWAAGAISDSTVFANAPDLEAIAAQARVVGLPVGVHLNLTFGVPLSDPAAIPDLVGGDGRFRTRAAWPAPPPAAQVGHEWALQLARVITAGLVPSHLDSHHHVHAQPALLPVAVALARAHGLPLRATTPAGRDALRAAGLRCPDHFSMAFYGEAATVETLVALTSACPGGILEIMTHPGHDDPALPSSYRAARAQELAALADPRWRAWRAERGVATVGFDGVR